MSHQIQIKNLGKLRDANIRLGRFTVFAGRNNTGKSFVSKALYSIFRAMNANHLAIAWALWLDQLDDSLSELNLLEGFDSESLGVMIQEIKSLREVINGIDLGENLSHELAAIDAVLPDIHNRLDVIRRTSSSLVDDCRGFIEKNGDSGDMEEGEVDHLEACVSALCAMGGQSSVELIVDGFRNEIWRNLVRNFQVPNPGYLRGPEENVSFNIGDVIKFDILKESMDFTIVEQELRRLRQYSKVLYLESPVFWQLQTPLVNVKNTSRFLGSRRRRLLTGVPEYFYDMSDELRKTYEGDVLCQDALSRLTSDRVLGGRVVIGESGDLGYQETEGEEIYPLLSTATGIVNLGMLALLIKEKHLDKDTILFVDEPESNLHPEWQVEMAKALFALAKAGVSIVVATHSADILKWLEVCEDPEKEEIVALNHFRNGTVLTNGGDFENRLNAIQEDLTDPYYRLYYQGIAKD